MSPRETATYEFDGNGLACEKLGAYEDEELSSRHMIMRQEQGGAEEFCIDRISMMLRLRSSSIA